MKHTPVISAWLIAGAVGLAVGIAAPAGANTLDVLGPSLSETAGEWTCDVTCEGFTEGNPDMTGDTGEPTTTGVLSTSDAWGYDVQPSNPTEEVNILEILTGLDLSGAPVNKTEVNNAGDLGCTTSGGADCSFTSNAQWLIAKIDGFTAFFKLSGVTTIDWDQTGTAGGLSHITEVGVIPLPATLPLFLTGLAGLGFLARRRRQAMEV